LADWHRGRRRKAKRFQLLRIDLDVLCLAYSNPLDEVRLFDFPSLVNILMMNTLMCLAIDLVKLNLFARIGSGKDLNRQMRE
jgi:hypothetical protein